MNGSIVYGYSIDLGDPSGTIAVLLGAFDGSTFVDAVSEILGLESPPAKLWRLYSVSPGVAYAGAYSSIGAVGSPAVDAGLFRLIAGTPPSGGIDVDRLVNTRTLFGDSVGAYDIIAI